MNENIIMRLKFLGARAAAADSKRVARDIDHLGSSSKLASREGRQMGRVWVGARKGLGPLRAGVTGLTGALGFGAGVGLIGAFKVMIDEATEATRVNKQTSAALRSTGAQAWITKNHISDLATSLSNMSGIDDELIQNGENLLLTFKDIRNEAGRGNKIFDRTTRTMVDFAARFTGGKMDRAAILLGKALNDPLKGMTALQRVGVGFDAQQQKQIKTLVAHNDLLGAQKIILGEVGDQVRGQAKASTTPMMKLQTTLRNTAETIGLKLLPYVNKAANAVRKWVTQVVNGTGQGGRFRDKVEQIWRAAKPVFLWFGRAAKAVFKFGSEHPNIIKIVTALYLARKATQLLGRAFGGLIARKVGAKVAGEIGTALAASKMGAVGTKAGTALGAALGKAAGPLVVAAIAYEVWVHRKDIINAVQGQGGPGTISFSDVTDFVQDKPPLRGPQVHNIGNIFGGAVPQVPGITPRGGHHGPSSRPKVVAPHVPAMAGGGDTQIIVPVHLDGKVVAEVVAHHTRSDGNRR